MRRGIRVKDIKIVTKQNGTQYVYRRVNGALVPLPDLPENDPDFLAAYVAVGTATRPERTRAPQGTIAALCGAYLKSNEFKHLGSSSQPPRRRIVDKISSERGTGMVRDQRPDHVRRDVRALTHGASLNRLKTWRGLLAYALAEGMVQTGPSRDVKPTTGKTTGHHQWTRREIDQFRDHWPDGTQARIAFEVIYWTGARCVDAARLGSRMVDKTGWLAFIQK